MLTEQGLIEFKTTSKGLRVLQLQNEINEEFDAIDDERKRRVLYNELTVTCTRNLNLDNYLIVSRI